MNAYDGQPGVSDAQRVRQAAVFRDLLDACAESGVCHTYMMFGFTDRLSWPLLSTAPWPAETPTMLDADYTRKPAYDALRAGLAFGLRRLLLPSAPRE